MRVVTNYGQDKAPRESKIAGWCVRTLDAAAAEFSDVVVWYSDLQEPFEAESNSCRRSSKLDFVKHAGSDLHNSYQLQDELL
jgi:hypothetical protein